MKTSDFNYDLPEDLIAKYPPSERTDSRLLVFNDKEIKHEKFSNLLDYLKPNDLLVLNESAVIPARLIGEKKNRGKSWGHAWKIFIFLANACSSKIFKISKRKLNHKFCITQK